MYALSVATVGTLGGTKIAGSRYLAGRVLVRTQELLLFEVFSDLCAASNVSYDRSNHNTKIAALPLFCWMVTFSCFGNSVISIPNMYFNWSCASSNTGLNDLECVPSTAMDRLLSDYP